MIKNIRPLEQIICCGDVHWGRASNSPEMVAVSETFFQKLLKPFVVKVLTQYPNTQLIFEGDWFNDKQEVATIVQNKSMAILEEFTKLLPVWLIVGNHDSPMKDDTTVNSVKAFKHIDNLQLIEEPMIVPVANGEKMLLIPFIGSKERELEILKSMPAEWGIGHGSIAGFFYEGVAVDASKHNQIDDFKHFIKYRSGHIHKRQTLANILFSGTPYHTRESEINNTSGFDFVDLITRKETYIENKVSPRYKSINLSELMNMKVSEANAFVKNSWVSILMPSSIMYKLNVNSINDVLTGFRKLEPKPMGDGKRFGLQQPTTKDTPGITEQSAAAISVPDKLNEYIDSTHTVLVNKKLIEIPPALKEKLKTSMQQLYKTAEQKVNSEPFEF